MRPSKVAVLCDLVEERWPSMDFAAEAMVDSLTAYDDGMMAALKVCPPMSRRFSRTDSGPGYSADRLLNRFWDYPRLVRSLRSESDLFHVVDHSYAQLVLELPAARTVVSCYDADTFRCLTHPDAEPRSPLFKMMVRRTLAGLRSAAKVCCVSAATRQTLINAGLLSAHKLCVIPMPVHEVFSPAPSVDDDRARDLLGPPGQFINLLNVGSTIPRKRLDLLLRVVGGLRSASHAVRLVRVGGTFTQAQQDLARRLRLDDHILVLPSLTRSVLAAVYRRCDLVMMTTEREGFGLPVVEALASGTPVLASDLPVLREVGGDAATYAPVEEVDGWVANAARLLTERVMNPVAWAARRQAGVAHSRAYNYDAYARRLVGLYSEVLAGAHA